jgi:plastocyanin
MRRRTLLAAVGTAVATGLAGCGGSPDGTGATDGSRTTAATDTATPVDTPGATDTATAAPADTPTPTDTATTAEPPFETPGGTDTATATQTDGVAQTVAVGPDFGLRFGPETFEVAAGGTVRWVWESDNHNVVADATPAGSDWTGTAGGASRTFDSGHTYEYTFETAGSYEYYCSVHRGNGMTGSFTVVEG